MSDINSIHLTGRLGQNPEMKYFESGTVVVNFSIASDEYQGQKKGTKTNWFACRAWGKTAEYIGEYAKQGSLVFIDGRLTTENYQTTEGQKREKQIIVINELKVIDKK